MERRQPSPQEGAVDAVGKFTPHSASISKNLPKTRAEAEAMLKKSLDVKQTGPDTFTLGIITFNTKQQTLTIPSIVNQQDGLIEYALVTESGKRHESLFYTKARAEQVHLACLLLGVTPSATSRFAVEVTWKKHGPEARYSLAELVLIRNMPTETGHALTGADWTYNGSYVGGEGFAAQMEGSIIALISDNAALANNPRTDRGNDKIHFPNTPLLPAKGMPVEIILKFNLPSAP